MKINDQMSWPILGAVSRLVREDMTESAMISRTNFSMEEQSLFCTISHIMCGFPQEFFQLA